MLKDCSHESASQTLVERPPAAAISGAGAGSSQRTAADARPAALAIKRTFDLIAAALGLVVLSPMLACVAIAVRLQMGKPVLFRQVRPGYRMRHIEVLKFRTMTNETDSDGNLLPDNQRLTRLGRFLRSTSLDEFPQLWNVIRGDLSLVGPRPLLIEYLPYYTADERKRFEVRPGITGWAQIRGRNITTWDARLSDDAWYVDQWSLWLDAKILFRTLTAVLFRHGVAADQYAVLPSLATERADRPTTSP